MAGCGAIFEPNLFLESTAIRSGDSVTYTMPLETTNARSTARFLTVLATKTAIVVLLFTVAGLATLAKNGQYYPQSNPARNVSISTKMNVAHAPVQLDVEPSRPTARLAPPQPPLRAPQASYAEVAPTPPIGVRVSMQHRSPPRRVSQTSSRFFQTYNSLI